MTRMSIQKAADIARDTGDTQHLSAHWKETQVALVHDGIGALLDDPPKGLSMATVALLNRVQFGLRRDLERMRGGQ